MDRTTYGLDIAKSVMQLHWVEAETGEIGRKKLARAKLAAYFAQREPVCIVMKACGSAHHWARVLSGLCHRGELLPAAQVRPFVRSHKDDAADARVGTRVLRQHRAGASARGHWRQGARGALVQTRRSLPAHAAHPRGALGDRARQGQAQVGCTSCWGAAR